MPQRRVRRRSTLGDHRPTQTRLAPRGGPFEPGEGVVDAARRTGDEVLAGKNDESVDVIRVPRFDGEERQDGERGQVTLMTTAGCPLDEIR
jgi:hypothetical protein